MVGIGPHRVRGRPPRRVQGPHPRRAAQRHRPAPQPDPGAARRRTAGQHRRHRRHERQPGLHRRPARRRRVVLARPVLEGADRRHHADRRDGRGGDAARAAPPGRPRRAADAAHARRRCGVAARRPSRGCGRSPTAPPTCRCSAARRSAPGIGTLLRPIATPITLGGLRRRGRRSGDVARSAIAASCRCWPARGAAGRRAAQRPRAAAARRSRSASR